MIHGISHDIPRGFDSNNLSLLDTIGHFFSSLIRRNLVNETHDRFTETGFVRLHHTFLKFPLFYHIHIYHFLRLVISFADVKIPKNLVISIVPQLSWLRAQRHANHFVSLHLVATFFIEAIPAK